MQPTHTSRKSIVRPTFKRTPQAANWCSTRQSMSTYIGDEIQAYSVIRDLALAEAEQSPTALNLDRAQIANDFLENALKPARSPYENQYLPAGDVARERNRCKTVKVRLALLRSHLDSLTRDHAHAA